MGTRISQLPPKGANLADTDLLMISQTITDGYESKSITGAEIIASAQDGVQPTLVSGTNIKTVNSTSLLGSGNVAVQPTLVSGTNIKTINGNTLLGSGDLVVGGGLTIGTTAITSGTVGRVLFEGTGNVVQESANLFWDNTNSRLGIGTASPSALLHTVGSVTASGGNARGNYMQPTLVASANNNILVGLDISPTFTNGAFTSVTNMLLNMSSPSVSGASIFVNKYAFNNGWIINIKNGTTSQTGDIFQSYGLELGSSNTNVGGILRGKWGVGYSGGTNSVPVTLSVNGSLGIGITTDAGFKLDVNGTARVQSGLTISGQTANNYLTIGTGTGNAFFTWSAYFLGVNGVKFRSENLIGDPSGTATTVRASAAIDSRGYLVTDSIGIGTTTNTINASAIAQIDSTTKGFLPPRMTNAQMVAIATPASGLMVYDTTNNKMCVYDGTAWQNLY